MSSPFAPSDGLLVTASGTRVFFDFTQHRLRHGSPGVVPANVMLRVEGSRCRLLVAAEGGRPLLSCAPPEWDSGPCRLEKLDDPFSFARFSFARGDPRPGLLSIHAGNAALVALPNGRISLLPDRGVPEGRFAVLTGETLRVSDALLQGSWLDVHLGSPATITMTADGLAIGSLKIPLSGVPGPFVAEDGPIRRVHVIAPGGTLHGFVRYRPLICFAVFGSDRYYQCLSLALESLDRHGLYDGDVCIAADRPRSTVAAYVPDAFRQRWIYAPADPRGGLFTRYHMEEWGVEAFQPLLYMDVDVVANAPVAPMLRYFALSGAIHLATENRLLKALTGKPASSFAATETGDWFGTWLCEGDPRFAHRRFDLGSSGILGFANIEIVRTAFKVIRAMRRVADPARIERFTDQALANYALHLLGGADFAMLDQVVDFVRGYDKTPRERRGLVHFHSGVGNADGKYQAMRRYLREIEAPATDLPG